MPEEIIIPCPVCDGKAQDPTITTYEAPCPKCTHQGQIKVYSDAETCPKCNGTGRDNKITLRAVLCKNCDGDGRKVTLKVIQSRKERFAKPIAVEEEFRLYVDNIDSFEKVTSIKPRDVIPVLDKGKISLKEDFVQAAFEEILQIPFHQLDWGGEINDLYTSHLIVDERRVSTAFMLKGKGLRKNEMRIKDCGSNGDQIQRLFMSPAELQVIQFVGNIGQDVIHEADEKTRYRNLQGKRTQFCIIDGVDTARILKAYGFI